LWRRCRSRLGWVRNSNASKVLGVGRQATASEDRNDDKSAEAKRGFHGGIPLGASETSRNQDYGAESGDCHSSAKPSHVHSRACDSWLLIPNSNVGKITYLSRLSKQFRQFLGRFSFTA
jgi:hypothetical protein